MVPGGLFVNETIPTNKPSTLNNRKYRESLVPWDSQPQVAAEINSASWQYRGLSLWYPLNGNTFDPVKNNLGTLNSGARFSTSSRGIAAFFDGSDDYISWPSTLLGTGNTFTFSAWIYYSGALGSRATVYGCENVATTFQLEVGGGAGGPSTGGVTAIYAGAVIGGTGNSVLATNTWTHIVYIKRGPGATSEFYINGVQTTSVYNFATDYVETASVHTLGRRAAGSQLFSGMIQDVRINNFAMTAQQITEVFRNGLDLYSPRRLTLPMFTPILPNRKYRESLIPWDSQPPASVLPIRNMTFGSPSFVFNAEAGLTDLSGTHSLLTGSPSYTTANNGIGLVNTLATYQSYALIGGGSMFTAVGSIRINGSVDERVFNAYEFIDPDTFFIEVRVTAARQMIFRIRNSVSNIRSLTLPTIYPIGTIVNFVLAIRGGLVGDITFYANGEKVVNGATVNWGIRTLNLELGQAGSLNSIQMLALYHGLTGTRVNPEPTALSLVNNPWQIFEPEPVRIPISTPAVIRQRVREVLIPWDSQPQEAIAFDYSRWNIPANLILGSLADATGFWDVLERRRIEYTTPQLDVLLSGGGLGLHPQATATATQWIRPTVDFDTATISFHVVLWVDSYGTLTGTGSTVWYYQIYEGGIQRLRVVVNDTGVVLSAFGGAGVATLNGGRLGLNVITGVVREGVLCDIWCNGQLTQVTPTSAAYTASSVRAILRGTSASAGKAHLLLGADWYVDIGSATVAELQNNPWSLFAPRSVRIPISTGTGRIYYVIGPAVGWATPTDEEVRRGKLAGGAEPTASGSEVAPTVTTTPFTLSADATGLLSNTAYRVAYVWSDS
jgi:hypothetical protein